MATEIRLKKGENEKKAYLGFSWTMFFFSFIPVLCRGDILVGGIWAVVIFLIQGCFKGPYGEPAIGGLVVIFILNILFCIFYNNYATEKFLKQGYEPADEESAKILEEKGLYKATKKEEVEESVEEKVEE